MFVLSLYMINAKNILEESEDCKLFMWVVQKVFITFVS